MKTASSALQTFLQTADGCEIVDLYTITLWGGTTVRWTAGDSQIVANGYNFLLGPAIDRTKISNKRGVQASTLEVTLYATVADLIANAPLITYLLAHGLDGSLVRIDRAYLQDGASAPVGTLQWFSGRVTRISGLSRTQVTINASDWRVLFNVNMPTGLYQPQCRHALYDAGCTVTQVSQAMAGAVTGASVTTAFATNLTAAANVFDQGFITFTSGANAGITRAIKSQDGSGNVTLVLALPNAPAVGDAFTAYPGCDRTQATCLTKFNNLQHFGGEPFVPVPEVAVG
jgi:uncharacterized phage protein (TIGR02218 family)